MSETDVKCFLRCLKSSHPDILLKHSEEMVLGRQLSTLIKDVRCSRSQLRFVADCIQYSVEVTQVGMNPSFYNGQEIGSGKKVTLRHNDTVNFLEKEFEHQVVFSPPPAQKRKSEEQNVTPSSPKKVKLSTEPQLKASVSVPWFDSSIGRLAMGDDGQGGEWREVAEGKMFVRMLKEDAGGEKIAAFDIDGTLITTQSGNVFPKDEHDWKIIYSEVPGKLKQLVKDGYKVIMITNQAGIAKGKLTLAQFQKKLKNILARLGVNVQVFVSTGDTGYFRKPRPGIWEWLELRGNKKVAVSREDSFYCGDAAGRLAGVVPGKKKKDFSCSDRLFAENVGVKFFTPEEFFLGHKPVKQFSRPFRPDKGEQRELFASPSVELVPKSQTLTLMVGIQGSGKSFVSRRMRRLGTEVASNDITGGKEKTLKLVGESLKAGRSVVVDNTHVDREARKAYIDLGKKFGVKIRAFVMTTTHDHAKHNNVFRELTDKEHARIKEMIFNQYRSRYAEPSEEEGFSEIVKVNCVPEFENESLETLYYMALLEK